jgi:WASH complex subunit FAM21
VYDDDGEAAEEQAPAAATTVDDPQVVIKDSLQAGIVALKLYFSDETEDTSEKMEDIYNARPLPYIIGTKMYVESEDVGLGEEPLSFSAPGAGADDGTPSNTTQSANTNNNDGYDEEYDSRPAPPSSGQQTRQKSNDDDYDGDEGRDDFDEAPVFKPPPSRLPRPPIPVYTGDDETASVASEDSLFEQSGPPSRIPPPPRRSAAYDDDNSSMASEDSLFRSLPKAPISKPPMPSRGVFEDEDEQYSAPSSTKGPVSRHSDLFDDDDGNRDSAISTAPPLTKANIASTLFAQIARGPGVPPNPKIPPIVERDEENGEDESESWSAPSNPPPPRPPALPKPPMPPQSYSEPPESDDVEDDDDDIFTSSKDDPYSLFAEASGNKSKVSQRPLIFIILICGKLN